MATDTEKSIANNPLEEKNPNKTLDTTVPPSTKPDRVEAPTNTAAPNVDSGVDVILKEGEDSKSTAAVVGAVAENIGTVTDIQKKIRRAERFGMTVQLSEQEKRNSRAERFGTGPTLHGSEPSKKSEELKRKARAERFGLPVPSTGTEEEEKKKARLARFAPVSKTDTLEDDKRKARAIRFSKPPLSSITQVNGTGNVEPEAAIAGKAGGGV